jgi:1,2-diacylglycerol 3-alpha-glucosyltransferase
MRIALVSTGLGRVLRGFESFTDSLFQALRRSAPDVDVTLFQGGGASAVRRVVIPNLHRHDFPARCFGDLTASHIEKRSFALALYPRLVLGKFDVVHYNELTLGSALFHLRRVFGGKFKLLYCNGAPSPPVHYHHRCDFAQLLTGPQYEEAIEFGIPKERIFALPYGIDSDRFSPTTRIRRKDVRSRLGVPLDANVVLSVAAIKRDHKRIDYLIEEVAKLPYPAWLVVAGQRTFQTPALEALAESRMPGRWRFVSWPHDAVADLYGAADVFALASLTEGLPIVSLEALVSNLPVVIHNGPLFEWLAQGSSARLIDMGNAGALAGVLHSVLTNVTGFDARISAERAGETVLRRYSWSALIPQYREMYDRVASQYR